VAKKRQRKAMKAAGANGEKKSELANISRRKRILHGAGVVINEMT